MPESPDTAIFVSDLHFGAQYPGAFPRREELFCEFLDSLQHQVSHVFILGDLFEFWMEYLHYIPKRHFQLLHSLRNLVESGVEVHYLAGNHDFNLGTFFQAHLGIITHQDSCRKHLQGHDILMIHGDGIAPSDWAYRIVKKVLRSRWANFLFKLIHPDLGMAFATLVGKTSRAAPRKPRKEEYEDSGSGMLKNAGVVIHGHTHLFFIRQENSGLYINTGEWLKNLQYIKLEKGQFSKQNYVPPANSP